ncbi:MAG TPA: FtsX-like permease family protein [Terriglobales bacterium]|nr:FtsX-like permease family protein [Terriglobales bacterium]
MNPRRSMFLRMLLRAALVHPGRSLTALTALAVAATVATAMLNLYTDAGAKLEREFRNYGANLVVIGPDGGTLPEGALQTIETAMGGRGIAVPFSYAIAKTSDGSPVVVAGTDMIRVRTLNSWWSVTAWPAAPGDALMGARAAQALAPDGQPFDLTFQGRTLRVKPVGTLRTGAAEDSRIYLPMADFQAWTGIGYSTIEVRAAGSPQQVEEAAQQLSAALPQAQVRPVRQILEAEAQVLGKTRSTILAAVALILVTAALCVLATLTASVFDRRKDLAIMKALGASEWMANGLFLAEAAALGTTGAVIGFALGVGAAAWIGRANFHAPISPRLDVFPAVLAGSILVAVLSALIPISLLRHVQPAAILKGE